MSPLGRFRQLQGPKGAEESARVQEFSDLEIINETLSRAQQIYKSRPICS